MGVFFPELRSACQSGLCDGGGPKNRSEFRGLKSRLAHLFNFLENKVALAVPEGNPAGISSYDDLKAKLEAGKVLLAIGNSDVPVGQYTQKILAFLELDEEALAKAGSVTYGSNVKEVTTQVSEGTVDAGIIYQTDAYSAKLTVVDTATKEMCGQVIYPAAIMKPSKNVEAAEAFLDFPH